MQETVLGVDPGTQCAGWALLGRASDGEVIHVASGVWHLGRAKAAVPARLASLREQMAAILAEYRPQWLALESAFFGKNARSALRLGEARGVVLVTAEEHSLQILELPPAQVKRRIAGSGAASKEQVARLLRAQLDCAVEFETGDQSDAIAVGYCGLLELSVGAVTPSRRGLPPGASVQ